MLTRYPLRRGTTLPVLLEYADAQGDRSMRQVMPLAIVTDEAQRSSSSSYLQARCSIAKAARTFRFDRIETLSDAGTGETFGITDWISQLQLGEGRPFTWAEEAHERDQEQGEAADPLRSASRERVWRVFLVALIAGYGVGRLRLIHILLRWFQVRHGLWL